MAIVTFLLIVLTIANKDWRGYNLFMHRGMIVHYTCTTGNNALEKNI